MTEPPRPPDDGNPGTPPPGYQPPQYQPPSPYEPPLQDQAPQYQQPQYPPPGNQPPSYGPPGYGPPGYGPPPGYGGHPGTPSGYANDDEKLWSTLAHVGGVLLGFIAPLVVMLVKGNESPTVRAHAVEALNFQITWGVALILATILATCSFGLLFFLPFIPVLAILAGAIVGGIKANEGQLFRYPATVRLLK